MKTTLTQSAKNELTDDPAWDSRDYSLTLAGCLHLAGMPLASDAVAEKKVDAQICASTSQTQAAADPLDAGTCCLDCLEHQDAAKYSPHGDIFHIETESDANWYLKTLGNIEAEKARIQAQADKMIKELDTDRDGLKFLYQGELQEFVRQELARKGGRRKTLSLLQGTCAFRSVPASVKVADPLAALEYARANGLPCIVITERVDAEEYKKLAAGKMLPGLDTTPERESFNVTFGTK